METAICNCRTNLEAAARDTRCAAWRRSSAGVHPVEMRHVGMALTQRVTAGRIMMLDGGHLFPMEQPVATAAAMEASLLNLATLG